MSNGLKVPCLINGFTLLIKLSLSVFQGSIVFKPNQRGCFTTKSILIEAVHLKFVWLTKNCSSAKNISSAHAKELLALSLVSALQPQWRQPDFQCESTSDRQSHADCFQPSQMCAFLHIYSALWMCKATGCLQRVLTPSHIDALMHI